MRFGAKEFTAIDLRTNEWLVNIQRRYFGDPDAPVTPDTPSWRTTDSGVPDPYQSDELTYYFVINYSHRIVMVCQ